MSSEFVSCDDVFRVSSHLLLAFRLKGRLVGAPYGARNVCPSSDGAVNCTTMNVQISVLVAVACLHEMGSGSADWPANQHVN